MVWIKGPTPLCECTRSVDRGGIRPNPTDGQPGDVWECDKCEQLWLISGSTLTGHRWIKYQ